VSDGHGLSLKAYALLVGAVGLNAWLVTSLSGIPALAAFAATLGGTLSGALGFQVLARLQAWAKQVSSSRGTTREALPFAPQLTAIWARSQALRCDLARDGRNIRKDAWLQLWHRFYAVQAMGDGDAHDAIAEALIDHFLTFSEVEIDPRLGKELGRLYGLRFHTAEDSERIRAAIDRAAPEAGLDARAVLASFAQVLGVSSFGDVV